MKMVIDISEEMYAQIINEDDIDTILIPYKDIIKNGTPLPKGHGAIIDIKELEAFWREHEIGYSAFDGELLYDAGRTSRHDVIWKPLLDVLPTIIEADKEN